VRFSLKSLFRACCVVAVLSFWYSISMRGASLNTSWEHHAYAGPFILLRNSSGVADFIFSGVVAVGIFIPAFHWVRAGSPLALVGAIVGAMVSIWLSWFFAVCASC
jgi:hypothetical protein